MKPTIVGQCIYCGYKPTRFSELTKEHILPKGIGGADVLQKASCLKCAAITSELERVFIRESVWALRSLSGHKSGLKLPDTDKLAVLPVLLSPSFLKEANGSLNETFRLYVLTGRIEGTPPKPVELQKSKYALSPVNFCRVLAKIAHGYCVRKFGCDGFEPFLPDIVLGKTLHLPDIWKYVGGLETGPRSEKPHFLSIQRIPVRGETVLSVSIKLFAHFPVPSYQLIAGRVS
jgi:hypothetical protein